MMVFLFEGLDLPVKDISFYQPAFKKVTLQKMNQRGALSPLHKVNKTSPQHSTSSDFIFTLDELFKKSVCEMCVCVVLRS